MKQPHSSVSSRLRDPRSSAHQSARARTHRLWVRAVELRWTMLAAAALMLWTADAAHAEHANIDLRIISPDSEVSATSDRTPPTGGLMRRPVMVVKAGDPLVFQFFLSNVYPHGVLKGVMVHYYIVRIDKVGQKHVPDLPMLPIAETVAAGNKSAGNKSAGEPSLPATAVDEDPRLITQGFVTMNFKPRCKVGVRMPFRISRPGVYLVHVESLKTQSDHEHFSAIDLKVE